MTRGSDTKWSMQGSAAPMTVGQRRGWVSSGAILGIRNVEFAAGDHRENAALLADGHGGGILHYDAGLPALAHGELPGLHIACAADRGRQVGKAVDASAGDLHRALPLVGGARLRGVGGGPRGAHGRKASAYRDRCRMTKIYGRGADDAAGHEMGNATIPAGRQIMRSLVSRAEPNAERSVLRYREALGPSAPSGHRLDLVPRRNAFDKLCFLRRQRRSRPCGTSTIGCEYMAGRADVRPRRGSETTCAIGQN